MSILGFLHQTHSCLQTSSTFYVIFAYYFCVFVCGFRSTQGLKEFMFSANSTFLFTHCFSFILLPFCYFYDFSFPRQWK